MISCLVAALVLLGTFNTEVNSINIHAIYVSVLEIEQTSNGKSGNIHIKVFANDLEDAIFNSSQKRVQLLNSSCDQKNILVSEYFRRHLSIIINGEQLEYTYESCEINDISIWLNFKYTTQEEWSEIEITADYLMELFPTQSNVVSIVYKDHKSMFRLTKGDISHITKYSNQE